MSLVDPSRQTLLNIDPREADALYKPLPTFGEWMEVAKVETTRWDRYIEGLEELKASSPSRLARALEIVRRAAAFDTGALEGLYESDRGFTFTVAMQSASWELAVEKKGAEVRALFESQLRAYDNILDLATESVPIAEAWIRRLHEEITESQKTYRVWTEVGWQEQELPKGQYKNLPNHVLLADGNYHAYAPVDMTPTEMYRFCQEIRSEAFREAHPVLQASYAHYGLVMIHPFADGNGRVARALGSVFTFRAESIPLLILVDNRSDYLESLRAADNGQYQMFTDFMMERSLDAIQMASESMWAAAIPTIEEQVAEVTGLYKTKGGYSHLEIDQAGYKLSDLVQQEFVTQLDNAKNLADPQLFFSISVASGGYMPSSDTNRLPLPEGRRFVVSLSTPAPADADLTRSFGVEVPKDCGIDDDLIIRNLDSNAVFEVRVTLLFPEAKSALRMRISIWVQRVVGEMIRDLVKLAARSLHRKGY